MAASTPSLDCSSGVGILSVFFLVLSHGFERALASSRPYGEFSNTPSAVCVPSSLLCVSYRTEGKGVIIVEGILIFCDPDLRDLLDIKVFVDTVR